MNGINLDVATEDSYHLTSRQRALFEAIRTKNDGLSAMFVGAIFVLNDNRNPDRFALAAHGFRELMEKMPECFDSPVLTAGPTLKNKIDVLKEYWDSVCKNKGNQKLFNALTLKLFKKLNDFFCFYEQSTSKRKDSIKDMLHDSDPMRRSLPRPIAELRAEMFDKIWDYFKKIAHHRVTKVDSDEFVNWQNAVEEFMLDIVMPRTYEDIVNIDAIIAEGENQ